MSTPQPIAEWFGHDPVRVTKPTPRTKEEIAESRRKPEKVNYIDGPQVTEDELWFRHFNWRDKRKKVRQALTDAGTSPSALDRFDNCGCDCSIEWNATEKRYRVIGCYCHSRHCEPCMKGKSSLIINNLRASMQDRKSRQFRFITLTLKHDVHTKLKPQITRLYAAWNKLRKTPLWKGSQKGGVATLEIKLTEKGCWHPHLHIISEGQYISTYMLADQWYAITGDSNTVDVRMMSKEKDVAFYVGKYVTKGTNDAVWQHREKAAEFVKAVKGLRMAATYGNWRGLRLLRKNKEEPGQWTWIASLAGLVKRARGGETQAIELLVKLEEEQMYNPNRKRSPKPK
jgi:hypothetical protein